MKYEPTDAEVERLARILCAQAGLDPDGDDQVPTLTLAENLRRGDVVYGFSFSCRKWERFRTESDALLRGREALRRFDSALNAKAGGGG